MRTELTDACEIIYDLYPRHVAKRAAEKSIMNAIIRLHDGEWKGNRLNWNEAIAMLQDRTRAYSESPAGQRGRFTPHCTTWMNQSRYLDDPKEWQINLIEAGPQNGVRNGWLQ